MIELALGQYCKGSRKEKAILEGQSNPVEKGGGCEKPESAYPGRVWRGVPVEGHIPLALHFPVVTSGMHAPLRGDPLL